MLSEAQTPIQPHRPQKDDITDPVITGLLGRADDVGCLGGRLSDRGDGSGSTSGPGNDGVGAWKTQAFPLSL